MSVYRFPVREIVAASGRVWALGDFDRHRLQLPLYELRRNGVRHVIDLYDDSSYASRQIATDGADGLWTVSHRVATRWDGQRIQSWERPIGYDAEVLPLPQGAVIRCPNHYLVYRRGELGQPYCLPTEVTLPIYTLGKEHLVARLDTQPPGWGVVDLDSGRLLERRFPYRTVFRPDPEGNLYMWHAERLFRLLGDDLTQVELTCSRAPPSTHDRGGYEFLATADGILAYSVGTNRLFVGHAEEGAAEYGQQEGLRPGRTLAIRAAPDGRIWILRSDQLLVYDPSKPARPSSVP